MDTDISASRAHNATAQLIVAREIAGLSQRELAAQAGVSKSRVQRLETGGWGNTPAGDLTSICNVLRIDPLIVMSDAQAILDHITTQAHAVFQEASFEALQETLGDFVSAARPARPDLGAVAMAMRGHQPPATWQIYHSDRMRAMYRNSQAYYVAKGTVETADPVVDDTEFNDLFERLRQGHSVRTESRAGESSPGWHLVDYPRAWYIHRGTQYGILTICFQAEPDRIGDAEAFVLAVHTAMETGMDRLMVLRQRTDEGMLRRHELRLRELERDLAKLKVNAGMTGRHERVLQRDLAQVV